MDNFIINFILILIGIFIFVAEIVTSFSDMFPTDHFVVKEYGYIYLSPKHKDDINKEEIIRKIVISTIIKNIFFIIKIITIIIFIIIMLLTFITKQTKEDVFTNKYNLIQGENNSYVNIIPDRDGYILTAFIEKDGKTVLEKIELTDYWYENKVEFISDNSATPNVEITEKNLYHTNEVSLRLNDSYKEYFNTKYKYVITMPNDDIVKIINELNNLKW